MLTIFTIPKPFVGHVDIIQRNAVQSWLCLQPSCEVILCGNDKGVADVATEYNLVHLPDIEKNEFGTPLLSSAFMTAQRAAQYELICYVNADIIFLPELLTAVSRIPFEQFLLVGQRWDLEIYNLIDFSDSTWVQKLRQELKKSGHLHPPSGSDYFIFPKGSLGEMPNFAVGRPGWDNWFIFNARAKRSVVVDLTQANSIIHQNHDYSHVQRHGEGIKWQGPEMDINLDLMGGQSNVYTLHDATHIMTQSNIQPAFHYKYFRRRLLRLLQRVQRKFAKV